jgi:hypothetical protein
VEEQIAHGFRIVCGRRPDAAEVDVLRRTHDQMLSRFRKQPSAADHLLSVGETPRNEHFDLNQHAAMTMIASLLLNLDEAITKE